MTNYTDTTNYCDACLSVKWGKDCPKCIRGRAVYEKYCRKCMTVHQNTFQCAPWTPTDWAYVPPPKTKSKFDR